MSSITKDLPKEIMKRSRLRNNFVKNKTLENRPFRLLYAKSGNCSVTN